jgi:hypothetical protein
LKISLISLALLRIERRSPLAGARWLLFNLALLLIEPMLTLLCLLRRDLFGFWCHRLKVLALLYRCGRSSILSEVSFGNFEAGFLLSHLLLSRLVSECPCLSHRALSLLLVLQGALEPARADLEVMIVLEPVEELVRGRHVEF